MSYQPIENYGIIGDLHTAALVGMDGSIDFLCFPRFDSPTIFAALLDDQKGGRFQLSPILPEARQKQLYLPDSNVLLTRSACAFVPASLFDWSKALRWPSLYWALERLLRLFWKKLNLVQNPHQPLL